jgi:hypothetical protein
MERSQVLVNLFLSGYKFSDEMVNTADFIIGALLITADVLVGEVILNVLSDTVQVRGRSNGFLTVTV